MNISMKFDKKKHPRYLQIQFTNPIQNVWNFGKDTNSDTGWM